MLAGHFNARVRRIDDEGSEFGIDDPDLERPAAEIKRDFAVDLFAGREDFDRHHRRSEKCRFVATLVLPLNADVGDEATLTDAITGGIRPYPGPACFFNQKAQNTQRDVRMLGYRRRHADDFAFNEFEFPAFRFGDLQELSEGNERCGSAHDSMLAEPATQMCLDSGYSCRVR